MLNLVLALTSPPFWAVVFYRPVFRQRFVYAWIIYAASGLILDLFFMIPWHDMGWAAAGSAGSLIIALIIRWWRGKRRKAAQLLGAKTRALRDALVRKAREAATPRPVLAPGWQR